MSWSERQSIATDQRLTESQKAEEESTGSCHPSTGQQQGQQVPPQAPCRSVYLWGARGAGGSSTGAVIPGGRCCRGGPGGPHGVNADLWGTPGVMRAEVGSRAGMLRVRPCPQPHPCPVPGPTGVCSHRSAGAWIPAPPPPEPARRLKGPHGAADKGGNANTLLGTGIPTI